MFIVNADKLPLDIYKCNSLIAGYLVFQCDIPMLGKSEEDGKYCFEKNEKLKKALDEMPFWYKIDFKI